MLRLLLGFVGVEVNVILRRAATTVLLIVLGALLVGCAAFALLVAIFFALAEAYDPIVAALLISAISFVGGAIVLLIAYLGMRTSRRRTRMSPFAVVPPAVPLTNQPIGPSPPLLSTQTVLGIAAVAAIAGLILGRRI